MSESETIDDGGPAFPTYGSATQIPGMSILDWFAGQSITGIHGTYTDFEWPPEEWHIEAAKCAYKTAIAMLNERERISAVKP